MDNVGDLNKKHLPLICERDEVGEIINADFMLFGH
jgi:hypothetical protein